MKVCIIGNGLVSLALANVLIQKDLLVDIIIPYKYKKYPQSRTLGISKSNLEYFNSNILNIKKVPWEIKQIKIYTEKFTKNEIINFSNSNKQIFSMIKNHKLNELLIKNLKKNKKVKFKKNVKYNNLSKEDYKLIINCETNHEITKKFFSKKIEKKYNSYAFTTVLSHKKLTDNNVAIQIFTKNGPIAFLPISNTHTSVVYSHKIHKDNNKIDIKNLIKKFNPKYQILKIGDCSKFELRSSNLRNYYNGNILAFGDLLHKLHPLAGQGFNMCLRDIKLLSELIDHRINIGLDIDSSICHEFQKNIQDKNFLFSNGIDWVYEIFNFESKIKNQLLGKSINIVGKNKLLNSFFKNFADTGLRV